MSSLTSFQKYQLDCKPSKQILIFQCLILIMALACIFYNSLPLPLKYFLAITALLYATITLVNYWQIPRTCFYLQNCILIAQSVNNKTSELQYPKWMDWGHVVVLNAKHTGKNRQWIWLFHDLNFDEKRNLRLMIRTFIKKEHHSMPSLSTNPVL